MADQSPADQTPPSSGMQSFSVDSQPPSSSSTPQASEYWPLVMDIARRNKLPRIMRCCQIMGRSEQDELSAAQILYPCMQCADIFFLKADIFQLGMDQRKVNVLTREFKSLTKTNYFEMLEELDISDNQIKVLPESFRLLSKLRVFRADETPLEVPPREVIKLGAQAVVEFMADLIAKRDTKAAPPKKEKGRIRESAAEYRPHPDS
ncbi:hypothetical protein GOBAR_DD14862 [Gossypium barbadense]|nr:hypothetical protein GOBAR_DD14862 [Gossypium barbadense]